MHSRYPRLGMAVLVLLVGTVGKKIAAADRLLTGNPIKCYIDRADCTALSRQGAEGIPRLVFHLTLVNEHSSAVRVSRASLGMQLYGARYRDLGGNWWSVPNPLESVMADVFPGADGMSYDLHIKPGVSNAVVLELMAVGTPFVLVNAKLIGPEKMPTPPRELSTSLFSTVAVRHGRENQTGVMLLKGYSRFPVRGADSR
jgi:hypothetical protein